MGLSKGFFQVLSFSYKSTEPAESVYSSMEMAYLSLGNKCQIKYKIKTFLLYFVPRNLLVLVGEKNKQGYRCQV
jgi:hypothetical protein